MDDKDWQLFKKKLNDKTGIDLDLYKEAQMRRRIGNLVDRSDVDSYVAYFNKVSQSREEFASFIEYLTINVSEFFRNPDKFDIVEKDVLPMLLKKSPKLNIWSAGCSIGAEPYTLAIILKELTPNVKHRILATDLDVEILAKAKKGVYTDAEIKALRPDRKAKYFVKGADGKFAIKPEIKSMVEFQQHNLLKDPYQKGYNLIVNRNVCIYFTDDAKTFMYTGFLNSLVPGGILFVGATESILNYRQIGFESYRAFFYRKPEDK